MESKMTREQTRDYLQISDSTLCRLLKNDGFPKPTYLTPRHPRFCKEKIDAWLENRLQ